MSTGLMIRKQAAVDRGHVIDRGHNVYKFVQDHYAIVDSADKTEQSPIYAAASRFHNNALI